MKFRIIILLALTVFFSSIAIAQSVDETFVSLDSSEFIETMDDSEFVGSIEDDAISRKKDGQGLKVWISMLSLAMISAVLVRFSQSRYARQLVLLGSLVYFGFISGGCPCVISAFQNLVLFLLGVEVHWHNIAFILGIMVFTLFAGRVWCGWVCHLGALQEFLYSFHSKKPAFLRSPRTQKILKRIRLVLFLTLIGQLVITRENLFKHIDPFKAAFNLSSYYMVGWILLALLLVTSVFIYRPFCQAVCPVGLLLSWVGKIPGASILTLDHNCNGCRKCVKTCLPAAIQNEKNTKRISIRSEDCIMCGNCLDTCKGHIVRFSRKPLKKEPIPSVPEIKN